MKIQRFKAKSPTIMLTPMLDMFTMILIFLITSFAPDETRVKKSANIHLPMTAQKLKSIPHIQIEVTKEYVKLNGNIVQGLVPENSDSKTWDALRAQLDQIEKTNTAQGNKEKEPIMLLADKETSFQYIDRTVAHLAAAGYGSVYLVSEKGKDDKQ